MEELDAAFAALGADPQVRGVILTGAGEKAFVAGADIGELATQSPVDGKERSIRGQKVLDRIENLGKPVIAAVNGFALGGGCELALACHVRVASENARLGTPEVKLGHHVRLRGHAAAAAPGGQGPRARDAADGRDGGRRRRRCASAS